MVLESKIKNYWEGEAQQYSTGIKKDLESEGKDVWRELVYQYLPHGSKNTKLKILDIGTGPGFFPIIFGLDGHDVTGIDLTENMLGCAMENAMHQGVVANFLRMDCQALDFADNSFDLLISRNLTWILEYPKKTYKEWLRVLKPGGHLLIFDANWNGYLFDDELQKKHEEDVEAVRKKYGEATHDHCDMAESERISEKLPMGRYNRPIWDLETLMNIGFTKIFSEINLNEKIYNERQKLEYGNTPMFVVGGKK
ncbi:MAG: class I SAM-dependent methyltransferase [Clostridiales bacterium]